MSLAVALAAVLLAAFLLVGALDLGVGLLVLLVARGRDRDAALAAGGRAWSAGATWTLLGFALVVAGLPATLASLRALWPPLVLMLLSLALRGGAAALRPHVLRRDLVDLLFGLASLVAAGCQGLILGWFVSGIGSGVPARHAGVSGTLSIWGLLCAAGVVGLSALLGSGWIVWSGRGALQVFGREVGRAAALLLAASASLCALWAVPTDVASHAFARGWVSAAPVALLGAASLACLAPFCLSLWSRRPAVPFAFAAIAAVCGFAAVAALASAGEGATDGLSLSAAYLALVLLIGSPLVIVDLMRRALVFRRGKATTSNAEPSHAGRRAGSLANSLHLS